MMFDKIIIGAGLYGLYAALFSGKRGEDVLVLEYDAASFERKIAAALLRASAI